VLNEECPLNNNNNNNKNKKIQEKELMDICMGMTFDQQARLDYKELIHVVCKKILYRLSVKV
jgi:hypothetical protein